MGPMSYLAKHSEGDIQTFLPQDGISVAWDRISEFDLIFMHRPCRPDDMKLLQLARLLNIPVWADYDDWLFDVPEWNQSSAAYHNQQTQTVMAGVIACADLVTVSTHSLYSQFKKINSQTVILPNAYRSDLFSYRTKEMGPRADTFVWRGSNTHDGDLHSVQSAFTHLDKRIHFLGGAPYSILSQMDKERYEKHEPVDLLMYWRKIVQLTPKVWLFPLDDCFFNQCKSNISWIEALHAGAMTVAPAFAEWKQPGVVTYEAGNADSFKEACRAVIDMDPVIHGQVVASAFEYMKSKYDITVVNEIRAALFHSLFHPSFSRNQRDAFQPMTHMWALSVLKGDQLKESV